MLLVKGRHEWGRRAFVFPVSKFATVPRLLWWMGVSRESDREVAGNNFFSQLNQNTFPTALP